MPVQKFKNFNEASKALWDFNPGADYYKKISSLYSLFFHLSKVSATHGIFKFRDQKEAAEHKLTEMKKYISKF